ncbi:PD-(D/E)XK motif protein [Microbacterium sp. YY-03]|uniref:PD-(D/E)XK motif protein n=1 Tax=Microbacterium sp. YY-03 TaxID=3421636 RepID=UPI003D17870D
MTLNNDKPEHLDPRTVEEYFRLGVKTAFTLLQSPFAQMQIDPSRDEIELLTPAKGSTPEVTTFERLSAERIVKDNQEWFRLVVDAEGMHYEAYVLIESIVDQLRTGASLRHAVSEAVLSLKDLLAGRRRLTDEKELGLIGELLVLRHLIDKSGETSALESWLGPLAEEHDFALEDFDAEVKTTKSELRTHLIGSDTQLEPSPGRPLYLVSIQLTRSGSATVGFTLPAIIGEVRALLEQSLRGFDQKLESLGWRDTDADLYKTAYSLRTTPRAYFIDDRFPAITSARLDLVVPQRAHVSSVSYRVNVTDLKHSTIGAPLIDFCEVPA